MAAHACADAGGGSDGTATKTTTRVPLRGPAPGASDVPEVPSKTHYEMITDPEKIEAQSRQSTASASNTTNLASIIEHFGTGTTKTFSIEHPGDGRYFDDSSEDKIGVEENDDDDDDDPEKIEAQPRPSSASSLNKTDLTSTIEDFGIDATKVPRVVRPRVELYFDYFCEDKISAEDKCDDDEYYVRGAGAGRGLAARHHMPSKTRYEMIADLEKIEAQSMQSTAGTPNATNLTSTIEDFGTVTTKTLSIGHPGGGFLFGDFCEDKIGDGEKDDDDDPEKFEAQPRPSTASAPDDTDLTSTTVDSGISAAKVSRIVRPSVGLYFDNFRKDKTSVENKHVLRNRRTLLPCCARRQDIETGGSQHEMRKKGGGCVAWSVFGEGELTGGCPVSSRTRLRLWARFGILLHSLRMGSHCRVWFGIPLLHPRRLVDSPLPRVRPR